MSNLIINTKKRLSRMERGQVLMVVAIAIVGIIAILGLALDVGVMFIGNARLRRAVDSAALAAALQFREGYQMSDLDSSAVEFLRLNGINDPNAIVQVCMEPAPAPEDPDYIHHNPELCTDPARKLVRVYATGTAYLAFLPVIGIDSAPIAAEATSETASVDVVLVIDRSESMTYNAHPPDPSGSDPMRDPSVCNAGTSGDGYVGDCHPFDEVKRAAVSFAEQLCFPYDRVAVVTFDQNARLIMDFSNDIGDITNTIKGLTVYQGAETESDPTGINAIYSHTDPSPLPSRWYGGWMGEENVYFGMGCAQYEAAHNDPILAQYYPTTAGDPSPCTTTNIGQSLYVAGSEFANGRQGSLWVVILLTDGVANAGYGENAYFCPESTWENLSGLARCNDGRSATRHAAGSAAYDAEDYAYDGADFVADGQNALIFTIGLGDQVRTPSTVDGTYLGDIFLNYAAEVVGNGLYRHATSAELREVFQGIAENIATRLSH